MQYTIGLWGPPEAGKTAFLCQLLLQLEGEHPLWRVFPTDDAELFLKSARAEIEQNRFPAATNPDTAARVTYQLRGHNGAEYEIGLTDRAGVDLVTMADPVRDALTKADAVLVLMDCSEAQQVLQKSLDKVLSALHVAARVGGNRNSRPVAICLTKVDSRLQTLEDLQLAQTSPGDFVTTRIDPVLSATAAKWLEHFMLFPVSAAGVFVHGDVVEPATFYDESLVRRLAAGSTPINLLAPLTWLIGRLDGKS